MSDIVLPKNNHATNAAVKTHDTRSGPETELSVKVNDSRLRYELNKPQFDGLESVFAHVPTRNSNNNLEWEDVPLKFIETQNTRAGSFDVHRLTLHGYVNANDLNEYGVAFGLKLNTGDTVWLEQWGDNYKPLAK